MLRLVGDVGAEVSADDAVPGWAKQRVKYRSVTNHHWRLKKCIISFILNLINRKRFHCLFFNLKIRIAVFFGVEYYKKKSGEIIF